MKKKKSIFRDIIKDIANKYENINKKLLISFKNDFVNTDSTHDVIGSINQENFKRRLHRNEDRNANHYLNQKESRRSDINCSVNNRYSSIHFSPKIEYGQSRDLNTAYTSNSRKRKTYYSNPK